MRNPTLDWYFNKEGKWQEAFSELREIVLDCGLTEELKWGQPCYVREKNNIVLIHGFKDYCALLFMQGAVLKDPKKILVQQTKNVQAARQIRFTSIQDIIKLRPVLKTYIKEAIKNDKEGLKTELKKTTEYEMPDEFKTALKQMPELKLAFKKLTPGRQRVYLLYFASAKQSKTRMDRVEKYIPKIMEGKGLED